jgi:hypothetical protein
MRHVLLPRAIAAGTRCMVHAPAAARLSHRGRGRGGNAEYHTPPRPKSSRREWTPRCCSSAHAASTTCAARVVYAEDLSRPEQRDQRLELGLDLDVGLEDVPVEWMTDHHQAARDIPPRS